MEQLFDAATFFFNPLLGQYSSPESLVDLLHPQDFILLWGWDDRLLEPTSSGSALVRAANHVSSGPLHLPDPGMTLHLYRRPPTWQTMTEPEFMNATGVP
jgi:hypothetical protein